MPDEEMVPQNKPAEMSFSDWKKMKSALSKNAENTTPKKDPPRRKQVTTNAKTNVNNFNNNYTDYRNSQNLQYFEHLKRNSQRILGGSMAFGSNMPVPQVPIFNGTPAPNYSSRSSFVDVRPDPNNFMPISNDFMMARGGIAQQPFPMNKFPSVNRVSGSYRTNKKQTYSNTGFQRKTTHNQKFSSVKIPETKIVKDLTATPNSSNAADTEEQDTSDADPATSKNKAKKQKRWNAKPPKPPTMMATFTESKEERQRMWREYRQKMKPFKNREYHNAKRVVQRLSKKNIDELDEKEKERLTRAQETVTAHKTMLTEKAAKRWTSTNESTFNTATTPPADKSSDSGCTPSNNTLSSCVTPAHDNNMDQDPATAITNLNQWGLWNNFVPGGVVFNSTEK